VVTGSIALCHTLIGAGLVDEYRLFVDPAVQGRGRRLFPEGFECPKLRLVEANAFRSGITYSRYAPSGFGGSRSRIPSWNGATRCWPMPPASPKPSPVTTDDQVRPCLSQRIGVHARSRSSTDSLASRRGTLLPRHPQFPLRRLRASAAAPGRHSPRTTNRTAPDPTRTHRSAFCRHGTRRCSSTRAERGSSRSASGLSSSPRRSRPRSRRCSSTAPSRAPGGTRTDPWCRLRSRGSTARRRRGIARRRAARCNHAV
jgi:hypothetical protein